MTKKVKIDITDWVKSGGDFESFILGEELDFRNVDNFDYIGEQENNGYFYSKHGWRVGVNGNIIDEIGLPLMSMSERSDVILRMEDNSVSIMNKRIHEVLEILNDLGVVWEPLKNHDTSRLLIFIPNSKVYITFDVFEGLIELISQCVYIGKI